MAGARAVLDHVRGLDPADWSCADLGGGSALTPAPVERGHPGGAANPDESPLACGAEHSRDDHASEAYLADQGRQLARPRRPARVFTLILSDIVADPLDAIASGPRSRPTTVRRAWPFWTSTTSARRFLPASGRTSRPAPPGRSRRPKPDDPVIGRVKSVMVAEVTSRRSRREGRGGAAGLRAIILSRHRGRDTRDRPDARGAGA